MRRSLRLVLLAPLVLAGAGLGHVAGAQTLTVALRQDPDILDPTLGRTVVGRQVFAAMCDKLFDIDDHLKIVPQLATGYEQVDPTTLLIHLRPDVLFQDGTKLDADAVKFSLERHLTMQGSFRRSEIALLDHVDVVDPLTVRLVLKAPSAPFLSQLTDRAGMIVSPTAAKAEGKDFGVHPVCAGPFSFGERTAQDHITLLKFPKYWNAGAIHFDRVVYRVIYDSSVRLDNLRSGAVDLVEYIVPNDFDAVRNDPKLNLVVSDSLGYSGITANVANGPRAQSPAGKDARVRQAFSLAIDRGALMQVVYNGAYPPTSQSEPSESPFYFPDIKPPTRDVARARALLKEAGLTPPVKVSLMVATGPDTRQEGEVIQSMAAEAGFDVQLLPTEFAASLAAAHAGDFELYLVNWSGRADIDGDIYSFLHTGGGLNDGHYSNPEMDKALDDGRAATSIEARRRIYHQAVTLENKDLPIIYLNGQKSTVGLSKRVHGYTPMPDGLIRLQGMSIGGK
jgi:peptide/nickel transport system substrate-binding protein